MLAKELIHNLRTQNGNRYYNVCREEVHYTNQGDNDTTNIKYSLCVQPGFNGEECQHIYGDSVADLAEKVGELVADKLSEGSAADDEEVDGTPKHSYAINIYDAKWTHIETYCICDTREEAELRASEDVRQLSIRSEKGDHIRIDEIDYAPKV